MAEPLKSYPVIGCCGIDCGLCPRFQSQSSSACPGCGGIDFKDKHPSCGYLTCCAMKKGLEVCSECDDYPCKRFDSEKNGYDSFVTHRMIFTNHDFIRLNGITHFIENQGIRIEILNEWLKNFDDGRSKSFFCIACALLPYEKLVEIHGFCKVISDNTDIKEKNKQIRTKIVTIADALNIKLILNKK